MSQVVAHLLSTGSVFHLQHRRKMLFQSLWIMQKKWLKKEKKRKEPHTPNPRVNLGLQMNSSCMFLDCGSSITCTHVGLFVGLFFFFLLISSGVWLFGFANIPRLSWVRSRVHSEQVSSTSQGHRPTALHTDLNSQRRITNQPDTFESSTCWAVKPETLFDVMQPF